MGVVLMKVLWITNFPLPVVQNKLGLRMNPKEGWLVQLSVSLSKISDVQLCVLSPSEDLLKIDDCCIEGIRFITYPKRFSKSREMDVFFKKVNAEFCPNVIHIQGSENSYGLQWIAACGNQGTIVSIQGMPSVIARYVFGGESALTWLRYTTIGDFFRGRNIVLDKREMLKRGRQEKKLLLQTQNVIGRTEWDRAHCWAVNPNLKYHFCNETLRPSFYGPVWSYEKCIKHSIFLPQATVPFKGTHKVIEACFIVKKFFPDVKIIVPQCVNLEKASFWNRLKRRNYGKYIEHLLKKYDLEENFIVKGTLSEKEMLEEYLKCNVFVSPSCIENSPNSLGEAQLLGVPTIASYVGGADFIADYGNATPLYRYEEIEMLAYKIVQLFKDGPNYDQISYGRNLAFRRHDLMTNTRTLYDIYRNVAVGLC